MASCISYKREQPEKKRTQAIKNRAAPSHILDLLSHPNVNSSVPSVPLLCTCIYSILTILCDVNATIPYDHCAQLTRGIHVTLSSLHLLRFPLTRRRATRAYLAAACTKTQPDLLRKSLRNDCWMLMVSDDRNVYACGRGAGPSLQLEI